LSEFNSQIKVEPIIVAHREMLSRCARQRLRNEIGEEQMVIKSAPNLELSRSRPGLVPAAEGPQLVLKRHNTLSHLQSFLPGVSKAPKSPLQIRWERRWTAASGAWFAVLFALLLGGIDRRVAAMLAATTFMLARGGDMLDDFDE
jgi:hypothetical protein